MKALASFGIVVALAWTPTMSAADDMSAMPAGGNSADIALMDSMDTMMKKMDAKPTGDPDKDFVAMMLPHHEGAVDMAKIELQYGKDPMMRQLATDIIKAQDREIEMMKTWQSNNAR